MRSACSALILNLVFVGCAAAGADRAGTAMGSCRALLDQNRIGMPRSLRVKGAAPIEVAVPVPKASTVLLEVQERGIDVLTEVGRSGGEIIARADNPVRRWGPRTVIVGADESMVVRLTSKEHPGAAGEVVVAAFDLAALSAAPDCMNALQRLAAADADYARAQDVSLSRSS
jgi:hypothetical protein